MARRCDSTDAGGAIGRVALDAGGERRQDQARREPPYNGAVASIARIKPGEPGAARSAASRSMPATCRAPRRRGAMGCFGIENKHYRSHSMTKSIIHPVASPARTRSNAG
jgi:hypothetical protein